MTDMRRTILWVVFSMSLVLLWDAWNKHTGRPSFFSPPPATSSASAPAGGAPASAALPAPAAATAPGTGAVAAAGGEKGAEIGGP